MLDAATNDPGVGYGSVFGNGSEDEVGFEGD
jgi:hypothetical protein